MGCGSSTVAPIAPALAEHRLSGAPPSEDPASRPSAASDGAAALKKKAVSFRKRNSFSETPPEWPTERNGDDITPTSRGDDASSTQFNPASFQNRVVNALLASDVSAESPAGDRPGTRDNSFSRGRGFWSANERTGVDSFSRETHQPARSPRGIAAGSSDDSTTSTSPYRRVRDNALSRSFGENGGARSGAPTPTRLRSPMSGTSRTGPEPDGSDCATPTVGRHVGLTNPASAHPLGPPTTLCLDRWNGGSGDGDGEGANEAGSVGGGSVGGGSVGGSRDPSFNRRDRSGSGSANDVKSWQRQQLQPGKKVRSRRGSREHQTAEEVAQSTSTGSTRRPSRQLSATVSRAGQLLVAEVEREVHGESRGETSCSSRTGAGADEWPPNQSPYAVAPHAAKPYHQPLTHPNSQRARAPLARAAPLFTAVARRSRGPPG